MTHRTGFLLASAVLSLLVPVGASALEIRTISATSSTDVPEAATVAARTETSAVSPATSAEPSPPRARMTAWPGVAMIDPALRAAGMQPWPARAAAAAPAASTARLNLADYTLEIELAAVANAVDPGLLRAVIHAESAFNPQATSHKGAQGLMQLMPATAKRFGVDDPYNPAQNIAGGASYLAWLLARFDGDERLATAAYNAGEGNVDRYGGVPPFRETQAYVARVAVLAADYRRALRPALERVATAMLDTLPPLIKGPGP